MAQKYQYVRYGRLNKRFDEVSLMRIVSEIEQLAGKSFGEAERNVLTRGADEYDLVDSGLEESMLPLMSRLLVFAMRITR